MSRPEKIRILIADEHFIVRSGLSALLHTEPDFEVVGQAETGLKALEQFEPLKPEAVSLSRLVPHAQGHTLGSQVLSSGM